MKVLIITKGNSSRFNKTINIGVKRSTKILYNQSQVSNFNTAGVKNTDYCVTYITYNNHLITQI